MKKTFLSIFVLLSLTGCSQNIKRIEVRIVNKEPVIFDSVKFLVDNQTNDTLNAYFSLYIKDGNDWRELYNDIYNKDRETLKKIPINPKSIQPFSYGINHINPLFKEKIGNSYLRIEMVGFYSDFKQGVYRIHTAPFQIKE